MKLMTTVTTTKNLQNRSCIGNSATPPLMSKIVNTPQIVRWVLSGFLVALAALLLLVLGPDKPSTTHGSISMTMAFAVVAFSAVNIGVVMRREREMPWSPPVFPYMGWIILGWFLTWAAVELGMLQRLLDTKSLTGGQWAVVLGLSLVTPTLVWIDKTIQLRRQKASQDEASGSASAPAPVAT